MNDYVKQYEIFRRLEAAACPLDWSCLSVPERPFRVAPGTSSFLSHIIPLQSVTGILLPLRILVPGVGTSVRPLRLHADWLTQPVLWVRYCRDHHGYCLGSFTCKSSSVVIGPDDGFWVRGIREGYLMGTVSEVLPGMEKAVLRATLYLGDEFGHELPFAVTLVNNAAQLPTGAADRCIKPPPPPPEPPRPPRPEGRSMTAVVDEIYRRTLREQGREAEYKPLPTMQEQTSSVRSTNAGED